MKKLIFVFATLLLFSNVNLVCQPRIKISPDAYSKSLIQDVRSSKSCRMDLKISIFESKNGKYGYMYQNGEKIKPVFDWASSVYHYKDGTFVSFVKCKDKYYILNLTDGSYITVGNSKEFLSCPIYLYKSSSFDSFREFNYFYSYSWLGRREISNDCLGFICETEAGLFKNDEAVLKKVIHDGRTYYDCKNAVYCISDKNPCVATTYFRKSDILSPDGTFFCAVNDKKGKLIDSSNLSVLESYTYFEAQGNIVAVVKENSECGVFYDGNYFPLKCTVLSYDEVLPLEVATRSHSLFQLIGKQLKSEIIEGSDINIEFFSGIDKQFCYYKKIDGTIILALEGEEVYRDNSRKLNFVFIEPYWIQIEKDGLYGLINTKTKKVVADPIFLKPIVVNRKGRYGRYKTHTGDEVITNGDECYTIAKYEEILYASGSKNYLCDTCLKQEEKIHYEEARKDYDDWLFANSSPENYLTDKVLKDVEKSHYEEARKDYDDWLFANRSPSYYLTDKVLKDVEKSHYEDAFRLFANSSPENYLKDRVLEEAVDKSYLLFAKHMLMNSSLLSCVEPEYKRSKEDVEYVEEWKDGNCYTHEVFTYNGFVFRENAITKETELYVKNKSLYIPLSKLNIPKFYYQNYYIDSGELDNGDYIIFMRYEYQVASGINVLTLQPAYHTYDQYGVIKISNNNEISYHPFLSLFSLWQIADFRNGYFFKNFLAEKEDSSYCHYRNNWKNVITLDEKLLTVIEVYDYNFNKKTYASNEGEYIRNIFKWKDKWIFVGSLTNKGYIGYENYYVALLDSDLNFISSSYFPIKGGFLYSINPKKDDDIFEVVGNMGSKRIKINTKNEIEWLE